MKTIKILAVAMLTAACSMPAVAADNVPSREHRAIWMSPALGQNWPSAAITAGNAESTKRVMRNRLDKFKDQNINVLYYHMRNNCATAYKSQYEPWAASIAGSRTMDDPAFDVFGFLVEEAHKRGIEVYAWVNPYRYTSGTSLHGGGAENYENSHPDWLLFNSRQYVLNPALEPVKQRVVDIISEIVTNYDVDGVVFDDYFYGSGGTANSADATQYNAYKSAGGTLSQADWRRDNVNQMVHRVNTAIKAIKPWCVFAIAPPGVACPPTVTSEYGLQPYSGSGDWQYNQIYCDPLAWYKNGDIDFMSPQIYWPGQFNKLSAWWQVAANKFNRHCYPSITLQEISTYKTDEFINEVEETRSNSAHGTAGIVYFEYGPFVNYYEKVFDKSLSFGDNMKQAVYPTKALTPIRPWNNVRNEQLVTNVRNDGTTLTWDAASAGRYTVYAYPKTETAPFGGGVEYLHGIIYGNSYTLPTDAANYDWYVAVYDRYGNEYSPVSVGGTITTATKPSLTYPANGSSPADLFDFAWSTGSQHGMSTLEVATDQSFNNIVGTIETAATTASVTLLPKLQSGTKYWWRVRLVPVNARAVVSDPSSFTPSQIAVTSPAEAQTGVSLTPTITWSAAGQGAEYTLEVSAVNTFNTLAYTVTTTTPQVAVPARTLCSGTKYYARVTATKNGASSTSETVSFTTLDVNNYAAPTFASPATDGAVLHCDQCIQVNGYDGLKNVIYTISKTNTFPTRTSFSETLSGFATDGKLLGEVKLSGSNLVDGTVYYLRARGSYTLSTSTATQYTDYSPAITFKYSKEAGVNDILADTPADGPVSYVNLQGVSVSADNLTPGVYIRRTGTHAEKVVIK